MKKTLLFLLASVVFTMMSYSQPSLPGYEGHLSADNVDKLSMKAPDKEKCMQKSEYFDNNAGPYMVSEIIPTEINMENSGTWDLLPDGTSVWRLKLHLDQAEALNLLYDDFYLPEGAYLCFYNKNKRQLTDPYTSSHNCKAGHKTSTEIIEGETLYLEYVQPSDVEGEPHLNISGISWFYRGVDALVGAFRDERFTNFNGSGDCEVNVNCSEGEFWQNQKRGVALIYVVSGYGGGFCTGSLINNTANNGAPYFLTADHCGGDQDTQDMWEFYFNFESPTCDDPVSEPVYDVVIGATKLARGNINEGSDFLLLELLATSDILLDAGAYYNGWTIDETALSSGVSIHHPAGDIKKISTYTEPCQTATYPGCMANAHHQVTWSATENGHGVTEGGSSGGPLFNANGLLVGTLTGGATSCTNTTDPDFSGRMQIHWNMNGTTADNQLAPWLDPLDSGATSCQPYGDTIETNLSAGFTLSDTIVSAGGSITVTDTSEGDIYNRHFIFPGGDPFTSSSSVQEVYYDQPGFYDVVLEVENFQDSSIYCAEDVVEVCCGEPELNVDFTASSQAVLEGSSLNFYNLSTGNIDSVHWYFTGTSQTESLDENPTGISYPQFGDYSVSLCVFTPDTSYCLTKTDFVHVAEDLYADSLTFFASETATIAGDYISCHSVINIPEQPDSIHWYFPGAITENKWGQTAPVKYASADNYDVHATYYFDGDSVTVSKVDYLTICNGFCIIEIDTCINGLQPADSIVANMNDSIADMVDVVYYGLQGEYEFVDTIPTPIVGYDYLIVLYVYCPDAKSTTQVFEARCVMHVDDYVKDEQNKNHQVQIYPNPGSGVFYILSDKKADEIKVFDMHGKQVLHKDLPGYKFDLSELPGAMYMVEFRFGNRVYQQKLMLE
ncbi:MAG: T9SS type A sorting domain-containing protein [Bacteroidales bacterium]